ncbi:glycosyltransferase family 39 protein [Candidatus Binatia bacterium]|nr:glycosyltransferase family 39 protein [Candidatus Binatia bacterium]
MTRRPALLLLSALLLLATLLRVQGLGDEPWLDEIDTHLRVSHLGLARLATTYPSQNQHVLYSLLARLSIDLLGDSPAAMRVPALLFGVLGIAATYAVGHALLSRREALAGAALLAVSEIHVWFSQNARGYTALLFFTMASTALLLRALASDRRRVWIAYGAMLALGCWVHLTMLFVVGGHAILVLRQRIAPSATGDAAPLRERLREPALGFAVAVVATVLLYAPIARDVLMVTSREGRSGRVAEWSSAGWAMREIVARLSDSLSRPWVMVAAAACAVAGIVRCARRQRMLLELLAMPVAIGLAVVLGMGHHVWPRLFFFSSGFAALLVAAGAIALGESAALRMGAVPPTAHRAGSAVALLLAAGVALGLPGAYGPKQRFGEAVALVEGLVRLGDVVVTEGRASFVVRRALDRKWRKLRTAGQLERVRAHARRTWLVGAFPLQLRGERPELARAIDQHFELIARFDGTLRGGEVLVWRSRDQSPLDPPRS